MVRQMRNVLVYRKQNTYINHMFVTDSSTRHYGTDPLLEFHLATAYYPLVKTSPLHHARAALIGLGGAG